MIMAAAGNESPNKSTEDKTSARRQNEGKKKHLIFSMSQIQTPVCLCFDCLIKCSEVWKYNMVTIATTNESVRYYSITLFFWTYAMVVLEVQCK